MERKAGMTEIMPAPGSFLMSCQSCSESDMSIALLQTTPELEGCSEAEIFTRDSIKKAKISTGMYTIYHQGGIMAGYSTDVRSIAAIRFMAILFPSPYCSRITGGCQLSSAVISGT